MALSTSLSCKLRASTAGILGAFEVKGARGMTQGERGRTQGWKKLGHCSQSHFLRTLPATHVAKTRFSGARCTALKQHQQTPREDTLTSKPKQKPPKGKKRAAQKRIYDLGSIQQAEAEAIAEAIAQAPAHGFDEFDFYRGLVLDISYKPIDIINWKRAVCMDIFRKADVITYYDQHVRSAYAAYPLPAVLRIPNYVNMPKQRMRVMLSRNNILIRDKNRCQYCGTKEDLTIDHVVAASRGGEWSWTNLVAACGTCNLRKGNMSVAEAGMRLLRQPKEPTEADFPPLSHKNLGGRNTPPEWYDYLPNRVKFFQ